jgi:phenylalanyl-tRNA synthetase beta chain
MLISMKLLRETVSFDYTAEELSKEFSLLGLEVESIERLHHKFRNIVTAKVENITQVKDTKLFKLDAFVKNEKFQIITAATNLHNGDIVPLALPHSTLANGVEIQPKEFKGVLSNGMLCSYLTICFQTHHTVTTMISRYEKIRLSSV